MPAAPNTSLPLPFFVIASLESGKQEMRRNEHGNEAMLDKRAASTVAERLGRFINVRKAERVDRKRVVDVKVMEFKSKAECEQHLAAENSKGMQ